MLGWDASIRRLQVGCARCCGPHMHLSSPTVPRVWMRGYDDDTDYRCNHSRRQLLSARSSISPGRAPDVRSRMGTRRTYCRGTPGMGQGPGSPIPARAPRGPTATRRRWEADLASLGTWDAALFHPHTGLGQCGRAASRPWGHRHPLTPSSQASPSWQLATGHCRPRPRRGGL